MHEGRDPFAPILKDMAWYEEHKEALLEQYEGQYIAILDGEVIDLDPSFHRLAERVFSKFGYRSVSMPRVERHPRQVSLRSPRDGNNQPGHGHRVRFVQSL